MEVEKKVKVKKKRYDEQEWVIMWKWLVKKRGWVWKNKGEKEKNTQASVRNHVQVNSGKDGMSVEESYGEKERNPWDVYVEVEEIAEMMQVKFLHCLHM